LTQKHNRLTIKNLYKKEYLKPILNKKKVFKKFKKSFMIFSKIIWSTYCQCLLFIKMIRKHWIMRKLSKLFKKKT